MSRSNRLWAGKVGYLRKNPPRLSPPRHEEIKRFFVFCNALINLPKRIDRQSEREKRLRKSRKHK